MIRSVFLPVTERAGRDLLDPSALAFARSYETVLDVLYVAADPKTAIPLLGEGLSAAAIQELCDQATRESQAVEADLRARIAAAQDSSADLQVRTGTVGDHVGRRARICDMALCAPPTDSGRD